jgi:hypothetical protein
VRLAAGSFVNPGGCALGFMHDVRHDGWRLCILNLLGVANREALAIQVARTLPTSMLIRTMDRPRIAIGNTMRCDSFSTDASGAIDTVVMRAIEHSKKPNRAPWGLSVEDPSVINVRADSARVQAFVMDETCGDKFGAAILHFEPLN